MTEEVITVTETEILVEGGGDDILIEEVIKTEVIETPAEQGPPGPPGLLYGTGAPSNVLGYDGSFYIDTTADFIYGPKAGGVWPAGASLIGPPGAAGANGQGVPVGGTTGQVLRKISATDFDSEWGTLAASVAGSDTQVQFNDGGALAGNAGLTFDKTTGALTATGPVKGSALHVGTNVKLERVADNVLAQRNASSAQEHQVYDNFINDTNYSRFTQKLVTAGSTPGWTIATEKAGSPTARDLVLSPVTGEVRVPGNLHVGQGASNGALYVRNSGLATGAGSMAINFNDSAGTNLGGVTVCGDAFPSSLAGVPMAKGIAWVGARPGGHVHFFASAGDLVFSSSNTSPQFRVTKDGVLSVAGVMKPAPYTNATEPSWVNGAMFFNTDLDKLRIGGAAGWETVTSA